VSSLSDNTSQYITIQCHLYQTIHDNTVSSLSDNTSQYITIQVISIRQYITIQCHLYQTIHCNTVSSLSYNTIQYNTGSSLSNNTLQYITKYSAISIRQYIIIQYIVLHYTILYDLKIAHQSSCYTWLLNTFNAIKQYSKWTCFMLIYFDSCDFSNDGQTPTEGQVPNAHNWATYLRKLASTSACLMCPWQLAYHAVKKTIILSYKQTCTSSHEDRLLATTCSLDETWLVNARHVTHC